ncbi:MAG: PKD domain-containing protein [Chloroflexota bacterium]
MIALVVLGLALLPGGAAARTAYYTGSEEVEGFAAPVDLETGTVGTQVPVATEGSPGDVAISPDGSTAYVTSFEGLARIDIATNTALSSIPMVTEPWAIAISPDGARAYTANLFDESVSVIDLASGAEVGTPIPVGEFPSAIAVAPDGARVYVANPLEGTVSVIDTATDTVTATVPVGKFPQGIAVTPDGARVYVTNEFDSTVSVIDVATNAVTATVPVGVAGRGVAIAPAGDRAFVVPYEGSVVPIDLATNTVDAAIPFSYLSADIAILPDDSRAYLTNRSQIVPRQSLLPLNLATDAFESDFELSGEEVEALAIVPDQPPHAAFSASPGSTSPGKKVAFDAGASTDPDGSVARYDWNFGDGTSAANAGPTPKHSYTKAGTYHVTLTTTDNEGCSTRIVFTGQTTYCNGSAVASATRTVKVKSNCPRIAANATSFKPKVRPGHVVPGVRVRLATGKSAKLTVRAKLLWKRHGRSRSTKLGKLSVNVDRWRRVRFPIPASIRRALPLGTLVTVKLRIKARFHGVGGCAATTANRTLRVRVVKVFPHAVQKNRSR